MQDGKFKKIKDPRQIFSHLMRMKDQGFEVYVWRFIGDKKYLAQVSITIMRKMRKEFVIKPIPSEVEAFSLVIGVQDEVNFYIPKAAMIFRCTIGQQDYRGEVTLLSPEFIAQIERRRFPRLETYKKEDAKCFFSKCMVSKKVQTQYFQKTCFDLSAGGFSVLVSKFESPYFIKGDKVKDLELIFSDKKILVDAQVVSSVAIDPEDNPEIIYKVFKISFRFTQIQSRDFEFLSREIFERLDSKDIAI
jgi:c-di-GMP-binding flagellar brake protein YcgR